MKHLVRRCPPVDKPRAHLKMDFDARQKARSRVVATNGEVVGVHIQRGTSLKDGDCLTSDAREVFMVSAESEPLSVVHCADPLELARAAYHLGNRHVRLQVDLGRVSYQTDHVLDDMVEQMGLSVRHQMLPFEPEPGAYHRHAAGGHAEHGHGHTHAHSHTHSRGAIDASMHESSNGDAKLHTDGGRSHSHDHHAHAHQHTHDQHHTHPPAEDEELHVHHDHDAPESSRIARIK